MSKPRQTPTSRLPSSEKPKQLNWFLLFMVSANEFELQKYWHATCHRFAYRFFRVLHIFLNHIDFVSMYAGVRVLCHTWRNWFSFHYVDPRDWTQIIRLGSKHPHRLSRLIYPEGTCKCMSLLMTTEPFPWRLGWWVPCAHHSLLHVVPNTKWLPTQTVLVTSVWESKRQLSTLKNYMGSILKAVSTLHVRNGFLW